VFSRGWIIDLITESERKRPVVTDANVFVCGGGFVGLLPPPVPLRMQLKSLVAREVWILGWTLCCSPVITTSPLTAASILRLPKNLGTRQLMLPVRILMKLRSQ